MSDDAAGPEAALTAEEVSSRTFPTAFRGFDPVEVRAFLGRVADELQSAAGREEELRVALAETAAASSDLPADLSAVREEADGLLADAKERAREMQEEGRATVSRLLAEAREEAERLRREGDASGLARTAEAEAAGNKLRAEAEKEAASIRVRAREEAESTVEAARERGREMVGEAQAARERMLADIAKRKRAAQSQLDQIRAGRDRLLETMKVARRSIDEVTMRFEAADPAGTTRAGAPGAPAGATPLRRVAGEPAALAPPVGPNPPGAAPRTVGTGPGSSENAARSVTRSDPPIAEPAPSGTRRAEPSEPTGPASANAPLTRPTIAAPLAQAASARDTGAAEKTDEPVAAALPTEERRSSALRILRRNKAQPAPARPELAQPPSKDSAEGVRILGPSREPDIEDFNDDELGPLEDAEAATDVSDGEATEEAKTDGADMTVDGSDTPVDDVDPDEALAARQDAVPEDVVSVEPAGEAAVDARDDEVDIRDAPELATPPSRTRRPGAASATGVEDLFARIRADREKAVTAARDVLADSTLPATAPDPGTVAGVGPVGITTAVTTRASTETARTNDDERVLQHRDAIIDPIEAQLVRRLKRALQDEQNDALDRLRTTRGVRTEAVLPPASEAEERLRQLVRPLLEDAARAGSASAPFGPVAVAVADLATELAAELDSGLRGRLARALHDAANEDLEVAGVSERISAVYREWKMQRIESAARHYLAKAWCRGAFLATPEGTRQRWVVDDDGPCPDCDDNALNGPTPRGEPFPTGQLHPPAHAGCRCLLVTDPA